MKNRWSTFIIIAAAVILSFYFLYPTYKDYTYRSNLTSLRGTDSTAYLDKHQDQILDAKLKRVKLGLDLQGGMRVVLEVDIVQLLDDLAKNKDDVFRAIVTEVREQARTNEVPIIPLFAQKFQTKDIRLSRYYGNIRDSDTKLIADLSAESEKAIDRAIEIVRNRVDQYRVSEPNIQKQGGRRIIVELPGVKDEHEVRQLLQGTAKLEFRLLRDAEVSYKLMSTINSYLAGKISATGDTIKPQETKGAAKPVPQTSNALEALTGNATPTSDTSKEGSAQRDNPFFYYVRPDQRGSGEGYVEEKDRDRVLRLLTRPEIQRLIPPETEYLWSAKPFTAADGRKFYLLYTVKKTPELTGGVITSARASVNPEDNRPIVNMEMNREGSRTWAQITGSNVGKRVAIVLDGGIFSAPVIQVKIIGGRSQITGLDTPNEARLLEIVLKAGALPAPVTIIEQRSVGPSLGEDSIKFGINSLSISFILTVLFMVFYYHSAGSVADFALLFNLLFVMGVLAAFGATLTLPGIAGLVLTIGMAVDANVLINERVREELAGGKTLRASVDEGYKRSMSAIIDSNVTTFLTGIILYQFGTGPVQGFALTLMIGIAATLFSAIIISRFFMDVMIDKGYHPNFG